MKIGNFKLSSFTALAPMAGISDNPMRRICNQFGVGWTVGEMISGNPTVRHTRKTLNRINFSNEPSPIVVQIAGNDPKQLAISAVYHQELGAEVIDINMGCPAKKVCRADAGSALMKNEKLVSEILHSVVNAVDIPVTLKTRLGWDDEHLNVLNIAHIAEDAGVSAIAIHGRSRTQMFSGSACYELIAQVKRETSMFVWANGDIDCASKAQQVLEKTGADGVMIGRAAYGNTWIFREINEYLSTGSLPEITLQVKIDAILQHLRMIYDFYGDTHGVRIARKHIIKYLANINMQINNNFLQKIKEIEIANDQYDLLANFLHNATNLK
ncbi:MAG: tRNA dihydrouridine synthase DusB [Neisseriaceae bacterium]|nr:tRNA dihydrouridine synthase DusB [Neisseriaceae bacterium]